MPVCFVIMGFGQKTDLATGRVLDLDKSYRNIIKPAVIAAGYECVRADEIQHSGVIDVPMYEMLFAADLVLADLSTANQNAIFELGVRLALKPRATIVIAESKYTIPFDANHIVVRHYEHLGFDIGFDETLRMRGELTTLMNALKGGDAVDSPVYNLLPGLQKPMRPPATRMRVAAAAAQTQSSEDSYAAQLQTARDAMQAGAFDFAKRKLQDIYKDQIAPGADGNAKSAPAAIVRELALATYRVGEDRAKKLGVDQALAGYAEAEGLLRQLDVEKTTDPETLRQWSDIHKHRAEITARSTRDRMNDLDEAIDAAERCFVIKRGDYNIAIDLAYLLSLRASMSSGNDRIADNVLAERIRREAVEKGGETARVYGVGRSIETKFYVSYAWADPTDPDREKEVDRLCDEKTSHGVVIVRDKSTLRIGDLISDFMREIGEGDRVFVFLSDKYLHSPYCMFELFELWRNSKENKLDFIKKVRLFTLDGTKIGAPLDWLNYTAYWVEERDKLKRKVDQVGWTNAGEEVLRRYNYMDTFATKIGNVLSLFADVVQPRTFNDFVKYGFEEFPIAKIDDATVTLN
jgi:TIR domain